MAKGVEYVTPVSITTGTTGSWTTLDISAYVPSDALAAVFDIHNATASEVLTGLRAVGSTDTETHLFEDDSHKLEVVKLNASGQFQWFQASTGFALWLVGYVPAGAGEFPTNPVNVTPAGTGWNTVSLAAQITGGQGIVAFFRLTGRAASKDEVQVRMTGSTDAFVGGGTADVRDDNTIGGCIGLNASEQFDAYKENTADRILYLGAIYEGYATVRTNASDYSTGTTGSFVTTTITEIPNDEVPTMGIFYWHNVGGAGELWAHLRMNGDTTPTFVGNGDIEEHGYFVIGINSSKQVQQAIESTSLDLKLIGWFTEGVSSSSSSASSSSSSSSSSLSSSSSSSSSSSLSSSSSSSFSSSSSSAAPGEVTWGHHTGVIEEYDENFTGNTSGWTVGGTPGNDNEFIDSTSCGCGEICVFERWYLGAGLAEILIDNYGTGSGPAPIIQYRTATTGSGLNGLNWLLYNGTSFLSLGWVQIRLIHADECLNFSSSSSSSSSSSRSSSSSSKSSSSLSSSSRSSSSSSSSESSSSSSSSLSIAFRITEASEQRVTMADEIRLIE